MNRIRVLKNTTDFNDFEDLLHSFLDYAQSYMGLNNVPDIEFIHDEQNGKDILGKTAQYDPGTSEIHVYSYGRHPKDMLRSIAHELVHHMQNEQGRLNVGGYHGPGYAQKNPALREIEKEAMLKSNICLRDWEDGLKGQKRTIYKEWRNNTMSLKEWKNKELNTLLVEKWGFGKIQEQVEEISEEETLEEKKKMSDKEIAARKDPKDKITRADILDMQGVELDEEEELEESDKQKTDEKELPDELKTPTDRNRKQGQNPFKPNSDLGTFEERLAKEIATKMLQNESLMKKLRGK